MSLPPSPLNSRRLRSALGAHNEGKTNGRQVCPKILPPPAGEGKDGDGKEGSIMGPIIGGGGDKRDGARQRKEEKIPVGWLVRPSLVWGL